MKMTRMALIAVAALLASGPMLFAQATGFEAPFAGKGMAGLGAGLTIIGAGLGFGKIGAAALESMARQPEVADKVSGGHQYADHRGLARRSHVLCSDRVRAHYDLCGEVARLI